MDIDALRKSAKNGYVLAQFELAHAYRDGNGVKKNRVHYISWLSKAAEQEYTEAKDELVRFFSETNDSDDASAQLKVADGYFYGESGLKRDFELALYWFQIAAENGNIEAQKYLAQTYNDKRRKIANPETARYWQERIKNSGKAFTEDELLVVNDANKCIEQIERFLFDTPRRVLKAKDWIKYNRPPEDILRAWVEKFIDLHWNDEKRTNEIVDLVVLACDGNPARINGVINNIQKKYCYDEQDDNTHSPEVLIQSLNEKAWLVRETEIINKAIAGDAFAQVEYAYLCIFLGDRESFLLWMRKAAEQENVDAQKELVKFYSTIENKYANLAEARYWAERCKANGVVLTEEELLKIGDADKCKEKAEEYLFGTNVNFEKAKDLILRNRPSADILLAWAKRYHANHKTEENRHEEITYLYLLSTNGDAVKINATALNLLDESDDNQSIAVSLFQEGTRLGNENAAASYLYCLLEGIGVNKDIKTAAKIYYKYKNKGVALNKAFAAPGIEGKDFKIPASVTMRKWVPKIKLRKRTPKAFSLLANILKLPNEYWKNQRKEVIREERQNRRKGYYQDGADGCYETGGCFEEYNNSRRILNSIICFIAIFTAALCALLGHIPIWLVCIIGVLLFMPDFDSLFGGEGTIAETTFSWFFLILLIIMSIMVGSHAVIILFVIILFESIVSYIDNKDLGCSGCLGIVLFVTIGTGQWFHYLKAIEWKYGSVKAFIFAIITLGAVGTLLYYLYRNGFLI